MTIGAGGGGGGGGGGLGTLADWLRLGGTAIDWLKGNQNPNPNAPTILGNKTTPGATPSFIPGINEISPHAIYNFTDGGNNTISDQIMGGIGLWSGDPDRYAGSRYDAGGRGGRVGGFAGGTWYGSGAPLDNGNDKYGVDRNLSSNDIYRPGSGDVNRSPLYNKRNPAGSNRGRRPSSASSSSTYKPTINIAKIAKGNAEMARDLEAEDAKYRAKSANQRRLNDAGGGLNNRFLLPSGEGISKSGPYDIQIPGPNLPL